MERPASLKTDALRWISRLVEFCQTHGDRCYGAFSPEVLRDYLTFHITHDTLAWTRQGETITGCGVAWQLSETDLLLRHANQELIFNWQANDPQGDAIFIADVVATDTRAALALMQRFCVRFPQWITLPVYTFRHGRLVQFPIDGVKRFFKQQYNRQGGH